MLDKFHPYTGEDDGVLRFWDYQENNIQSFIDEPTNAGLIADDMGGGKMGQACEVVVRLGATRTLFIGVKETWEQYRDRLYTQSDGQLVARRIDSTKAGQVAFADFLAGEQGHYFAGHQYLTAQDWEHLPVVDDEGQPVYVTDKKTGLPTAKQETKRQQIGVFRKIKPVDIIIADEVHIYANRKAIGRKTLITIKSERKLAMSGTWYGNRFENAWSVTRWLWGSLIEPNFYSWRREHCIMKEVYVAKDKTRPQVTGELVEGSFVASLPCYFRHEMPKPPEPKKVYVDLTPIQRAQYDELEADLLTWLKSHKGAAPLVADLPITLRSRLRTATLGEMSFDENDEIQFAEDCISSKLHALRGVLDHYGDQPVLIYTDSKRYAKVVVKRMLAAGYDVAEYSGDTSEKERGEVKRRFLAKELSYIVAVIPAFSTGLDGFQRVCSKIVWLSESENQVLNSQATARLHRPGMIGEFEHCKILARDTLDLEVFGRLVAAELSRNASTRAQSAA
jgi:hypothetical protein